MTTIFLISETKFETTVEKLDIEFNSLKDARVELLTQLNNLATQPNANDMQPTMNFKDRFHFWVKQPNGTEEKRHMVISKYYKSERNSLKMKYEALEKINSYV